MSSTAAPRADANPIGATLLFSLLLHGVLLLGLTFHFARPRPALPTLDVTLVNVANREAPDKADFLAQANNSGGGNHDKAARPSQPFSGLLQPNPGTAPRPVEASTPKPQTATAPRMVTTRGHSDFSVDSGSAHPQHDTPATATAREARLQQEMAQLAAEVHNQTEAYAKRPRKKFISANTREYAYAVYMRAWVDRIQRIGNLNYPEAARRRNLHGSLELTVGLNRDGSVHSINVIRSSGYPILDHAAENIVRLAAPFPPLPHVKQRVDILYITRTWQFLPGNVLRNR